MTRIKAIITDATRGGVSTKTIDANREDYKVLLSPIYTGICGTDRGIVSGNIRVIDLAYRFMTENEVV